MKIVLCLALAMMSFKILSCPQFVLKNVTCTFSYGDTTLLEEASVVGNILTFQINGKRESTNLPYQSNDITSSTTFCDGDNIIVNESMDGVSATKYMTYSNGALKIHGQEIEFRCDYPEGCNNNIYTFNRVIDVDFSCK